MRRRCTTTAAVDRTAYSYAVDAAALSAITVGDPMTTTL
jgi:hypothetical protein